MLLRSITTFAIFIPLSLQTSLDAWERLNATVNGQLIRPAPFARPCFQKTEREVLGSFDQHACDEVASSYTDHWARLNISGSYMNTQWETCQSTRRQCLLDWSDPSNTAAFSSNTCSQGNVPSYAVDVHTASDISAAFKFAEEEGVSLVIKNSGHDYLGRSSGAGTLAIRTTKLQSLSLNRQFIATNCPANSKPVLAITIGTGTPAQDVMDFADKHGVVVPMGADGTVSFAGGYTMGGGHGILVNAFGLAADRALEFEVVTPTGDRLFANACQNTDLFFALRGGGGGTFGVVVKVTTLALPHLTLPSFNASIPFTPENQRAFVSFVAEHTLELANQGWGGYSVPSFCFMAYTNPILDDSAAHASIVGVKSFIESRGGTFTYVVEPSYKRFFHDFMLPVAVGMQVTLSSRLVPTSMFESNASRANVVDAVLSMLEIVPKAEAQSIPFPFLFAHTPHLYSKSGGDDTSVHPAWRKSLWLVVHGASWSYNTTYDSVLDIYQTVSDAMKTFRAITPSASYLTETDLYEPDWQESFWGSNYDRLLEIKNKYDPRHLLDCWRCVGWLGEDDERYKCYIPAETVFGPQELVGVPSQHVFAYENGPMSRSTEL